MDTARPLTPLQFFQPGESPVGIREGGDFTPHAERVDQRSVVVFEGTDMDDVKVSDLSTGDIDPRDPRHDHSDYQVEENEEEVTKENPAPTTEKNLQVPFSSP